MNSELAQGGGKTGMRGKMCNRARVLDKLMLHLRNRTIAGLVALAVAAGGFAAPAQAFELFGINFFGDDEDEVEVIADPVEYTVDLAVIGADDDLEDAVENASNLWGGRDEPASGVAGLLATARGDYRRILAALYTQGYYGGAITILVDGREAATLPIDATLPPQPAVQITVEPGPVFVFGQTRIANRAPLPLDEDDEVEAPEDEGFATGEVARSGAVLRAERLAIEAWREQGHAKAAASRRVVANHPVNTLDATVTVEPGPRAAYGAVEVEGAQQMEPEFIIRQAGIIPGREYDPDDLEKARERLNRLEVFRALRLEEAEAIGADGLLPIDIIVQEQPLRRFGFGASYSTIDGIGLEAYWLHRNLFGQAERLRFDARLGGIATTEFDPEEYDYEVGASFLKPGVFTPDTDYLASVKAEREVLELYTETSARAETGFKHIFTDELSGRFLLNGEIAEFEDDLGFRQFVTFGAETGLLYDGRDSDVDPTEGFYIDGSFDPFHEFEYSNTVLKATVEGRTYFGLGEENRLVLAGKLKLGTLTGAPLDETPPDRLFFAGGGGSVRGYPYRGIGVVTNGDVLGGRSLIETSFEVRGRISESFGIVGFIDAGYVGADTVPGFDEDLLLSIGAGIRYYTGLGPIRLDVALPLDPRDGDPEYGIYVGIGQAF